MANYEVENEILDICCYGVFSSTCRDDKNELQTSIWKNLEFYYIRKKNQKLFISEQKYIRLQTTHNSSLHIKFQVCMSKIAGD